MKRLVRVCVIVGVFMVATGVSSVSAQNDQGDLSPVEDAFARELLELARGRGAPFEPLESPFFAAFGGAPGDFGGVAVTSFALELPLGEQVPFGNDSFVGVTSYPPPTNDYYMNSGYVVGNLIEVTEAVSACGPGEYREVALFITRSGQPTIGENPNALNDPGVGASEVSALVCRDGATTTFFGLPQNGVPVQYAMPYHLFESSFDERSFVGFITADPFAQYLAVASFSSDINDQEQYGFARTGGTYELATENEPLSAEDGALIGRWLFGIGEPEPVSEVDAGAPTDEDPPADTESETPAATESDDVAAEQPANNETPAIEPPEAAGDAGQADNSSGGGSSAAAIIGGIAAAAAVGTGGAAYWRQKKKKKVVTKGHGLPLLSDAEEVRLAGERAGLPEDRGWQQIPFSMGTEFRREGRYGTERSDVLGNDRDTDVVLRKRPWQWNDAHDRGLDRQKYFAFWINEDGEILVGSPTNPYHYDELLDASEFPADWVPGDEVPRPFDRKAEGTPLNLDGDGELPPG